MLVYLFSRLIQSLIVMVLVSIIVFFLIGLMPGDPIDIMVLSNPELSSEDISYFRALYSLDTPIFYRYLEWLYRAVSGDLGFSRLHSKPALTILFPALINTLALTGMSFILSIIMALPLGILAATRPNSKTDICINFFAFSGVSIPPFWLAILFIILFSVYLGVLPAGGTVALSSSNNIWEYYSHFVLPVLSLTFANLGGYIRYMRSSMIQTLELDFIRSARAKGLSKLRAITSHALRPSLIPVVTVLSLDFGYLFSGAMITETIFSIPGMGKLIFDSIMGNDFNLALVGLLFAALFTLIGNFLADISYKLIDPRAAN